MKLQQLIFRLFLLALGAGFIFLFAFPWTYFGINVPFSGREYKLGLDLQWGIELDYRVDLTQVEQEEDYTIQRKQSIVEGLKSVIDKRIQALNINDSVITSASYGDEEHIIVQIPLKGNDSLQNSENIERAKAAIGRVVKIEFKEMRDQITQEDIDARAQLVSASYQELAEDLENFDTDIQRIQNNNENVTIGTAQNLEDIFTFASGALDESGSMKGLVLNTGLSSAAIPVTDTSDVSGSLIFKQEEDTYSYIFIGSEPSLWKPAQDEQGRTLDDRYFTKASVQYSQAFVPMVELTFNTEGAEIFGSLTKRLVWKPIAIFVGGELLTAPTVNEAILNGKAVITGNYTPESAAKLAQDINTGVVPAPIYLTSERTIDARLGQDSLQKLLRAGTIGFIAILVFLVWVYRAAGLIGAGALLVYIALTLAILKQTGVVLTLASIAGLILSIGIAIDGNILIYERVKEKLREGATRRDAVRDGFTESFSAIWDSNITGLIVALILFIFGINMIKGFGLILALGILTSLFAVFFVSRLFMRLLARTEVSDNNFIGKL